MFSRKWRSCPARPFVCIVGKSLDVARRRHDPRSFEWRGREQVVSERIRHAEQLQRQRWIVRSKLSVKRVGIYLRVSTNGQTTENQRRELETVAARSGW
jgi:hypothetical protein